MLVARDQRWLFLTIVLAALIARAFAFSPYAIHHPDEAVQYLEQAHRLLTGDGVVPWEYRLGMRSWLLPGLLAGPMWVGMQIAPGSLLPIILPRLLIALIALAPIWAAWTIGRRVSQRHGLVAMAIVALWHESVYFSVHVLTETLATALILPAAALLLGRLSRHRLFVAGVLLGFAVVFRFHYGPAVAVLALMTLRTRWRAWGWLIAGGLVPAVVSGSVDLIAGQWPFEWVWANIHYNVIENRAAQFGEFGPEAYAQMLWLAWTVAVVPILWLAVIGARRFPVLAAVAIANVLVHLAIGHKEYRFILLSTQLTVLLAAIGTADVMANLTGWRVTRDRRLAAGVCGWLLVAGLLAAFNLSSPGWRKFAAGYALTRQASVQGACGIGLLVEDSWPPIGQFILNRPVAQYYLTPERRGDGAVALRAAPAYDMAVAALDSPIVPPGYARTICDGRGSDRLCLYTRPGGCRRDAETEWLRVQQVMERNGR